MKPLKKKKRLSRKAADTPLEPYVGTDTVEEPISMMPASPKYQAEETIDADDRASGDVSDDPFDSDMELPEESMFGLWPASALRM